MKLTLQFTVNCSACFANEVFNVHLVAPDQHDFRQSLEDAGAYFEMAGWLRLPSGKWVCEKHQARESAAAERRAA